MSLNMEKKVRLASSTAIMSESKSTPRQSGENQTENDLSAKTYQWRLNNCCVSSKLTNTDVLRNKKKDIDHEDGWYSIGRSLAQTTDRWFRVIEVRLYYSMFLVNLYDLIQYGFWLYVINLHPWFTIIRHMVIHHTFNRLCIFVDICIDLTFQ